MNKLDMLSDKQLSRLRRWCIMRQDGGFQGRLEKPTDTCYSFWIGATLELLGVSHLSDSHENRVFVLDTQDILMGGFAKSPNLLTDPLHTYLGNLHHFQKLHKITKFCKRLFFKIPNTQNK